jgi:hypothetical protein
MNHMSIEVLLLDIFIASSLSEHVNDSTLGAGNCQETINSLE